MNRVNEDAHLIRKHIREAEAVTDEALLAQSKLLQSMLAARSNPEVSVGAGQAAVLRLLKAQNSVASAYSDMLRVHDVLSDIARVDARVDDGVTTEPTGILPASVEELA